MTVALPIRANDRLAWPTTLEKMISLRGPYLEYGRIAVSKYQSQILG
jgi:hypothetical protein